MAYQIIYNQKGVIVDCSCTFTIQDIHEANGRLHGHAGFEESTYQIWNLLNADMSLITEKEMNQPAATDRAAEIYAPRMKVALVVRDVYAVKLCELYKKKLAESGSNWKCRIFDSMDHAQEWVES